tara:strand:- start:3356 stop:3553 length:198 start_codon:yes stop_codon:yes gene_type:complete
VEITTADKTSGIAGKEINCISERPRELNVLDASGRNNPIIREAGSRKKTNDLTERRPCKKAFNVE